MKFRDLQMQNEVLKDKIDLAINKVITECNFISGSQVKELEKQLSEYVGVKHCITCANGTDALSLALMAWNIGPGDAVFVPDFTFFASGEVVSLRGATPIFVDVDEDTFNISTDKLVIEIEKVKREGKFTPRVILTVDLFGQPADYLQIKEIAKKYNLLILEDAAQGFGGKIGLEKACYFGDISTTSFFPAKPLGCYGDGGAIFTNDDAIADIINSLRIHGKGTDKYDNVRIGINSRLDTLQAAILQIKLDAFIQYELDRVNYLAEIYNNELEGIVKTPVISEGFYSSWAQYTIQLENGDQRDKLKIYLASKEIPTMIYYQKTLHQQKAFKYLENNPSKFIISKKLSNCVLSLPMHPYLKDEEIKYITDCIKHYIKNYL